MNDLSLLPTSRTHDPMALATTPRQRDHVQFLLAIEAMTEDDLAAAVAVCPGPIRERLAAGPLTIWWDCGVCEAFGRAFWKNGEPDADDPVWRAWGYHEVPKLGMRRPNDQHYGELANESYRRVIATYRAAGWDGEAVEPNA